MFAQTQRISVHRVGLFDRTVNGHLACIRLFVPLIGDVGGDVGLDAQLETFIPQGQGTAIVDGLFCEDGVKVDTRE